MHIDTLRQSGLEYTLMVNSELSTCEQNKHQIGRCTTNGFLYKLHRHKNVFMWLWFLTTLLFLVPASAPRLA